MFGIAHQKETGALVAIMWAVSHGYILPTEIKAARFQQAPKMNNKPLAGSFFVCVCVWVVGEGLFWYVQKNLDMKSFNS